MYVRHEDPNQSPQNPGNPNNTDAGNQDEWGDWNEHPRGTGWRPNRITIVIGVIAFLFVATVIAGLANRGGDDVSSEDTKGADGGSKSSAKTLPRGDVIAGEGGSADLFGIPIKYPHTVAGGTSAAINESVGASAPVSVSESAREPINNYIYTRKAAAAGLTLTAAEAEEQRSKAGLDENGQVVNDDGTVDPNSFYLSTTIVPEYGVYRVMPGATDTRVTVELWAPLLTGTIRGSDSGDGEVTWTTGAVTVVWDRDDWRIDSISAPAGDPPAPANTRALNVSFAERASLFSAKDGWRLVSNATQSTTAYPDGVSKS